MYAKYIGTTVVRNDDKEVVDIKGTQNLDQIMSNLDIEE